MYHVQASFSGGELDPALHERTNFDKYQTGLKTLRNAFVGKTGRITSRPGTKYWKGIKQVSIASSIIVTGSDISDLFSSLSDTNYGTGTKVRFTSTGTLPTGISAGTDYYTIQVSATSFRVSTTFNLAKLGTYLLLGSDGTGTITCFVQSDSGAVKSSLLFPIKYTDYILEMGHAYIRIHNVALNTYVESIWPFIESDLENIQPVHSGPYVYFFAYGCAIEKMVLGSLNSSHWLLNSRFLSPQAFVASIVGPTFTIVSTGTGHYVDYVVTSIIDGEESDISIIPFPGATGGALPILPGEVISLTITPASLQTGQKSPTEYRIYRRPGLGASYGFVGSSIGNGTGTATFVDVGQNADYTHQPPAAGITYLSLFDYAASNNSAFPPISLGRAGTVYQRRLVTTSLNDEETIYASRPGYQNNFLRDFPLSSDSALQFKCGTSGYAKVLRFLDNDGLLVFTTIGIFQNVGPLTPENLTLQKKGNWVIDPKLPPLDVPGGVLFLDATSNTVRTLVYSNEAGGYPGDEISIFSNHLFLNKNVVSWCFQDGDIPLVWAVMDDGTLNTLTYQREQQMRGWSRHDLGGGGRAESVAVVQSGSSKATVYAIVNRNGGRYIEYFTPRFVDDFKDYVAMDSSVTYKEELSNDGAINITVNPDVPQTWDGTLTITAASAVFANTANNGAVGSVFRFFDSEGTAVDLTVTTFTSTTAVKVTPSVTYPSDQYDGIKLYKTTTVVTGLTHLDGKKVSLLVDGYVDGSPNNDAETFPIVTVNAGAITIPNGRRGAIVHVGLPFTVDIETLDIDTVEQKPALLEAKIIHKVYLKVYNSRGIFIGSTFPRNDKVAGLTDPEERSEDIVDGILGNSAQALITKRYDIPIRNDWSSNGRICIRQVDPLPLEVLSIIPDMSVIY